MKSLLIVLLSSSILVGCSIFQTKAPIPKFDTYAMSLCAETLELMPESIQSWDTVFEYKVKDAKAYAECRNKHKALVNSVNKYTEEFK